VAARLVRGYGWLVLLAAALLVVGLSVSPVGVR
jgi:hypothetical protein